MSKNVFFISDTHFAHERMYSQPFKRVDGSNLRPWSSSDEADEEMVQRWNALVKPSDKVYHLGDVAMARKGVKTLERLNGDKVLIAGNHDSILISDLQQHFRSIRAYWKIDNYILSHVPIHNDSMRNFSGNIHGHMHSNVIMLNEHTVDTRYINVCVEHIDYAPISWEELQERLPG